MARRLSLAQLTSGGERTTTSTSPARLTRSRLCSPPFLPPTTMAGWCRASKLSPRPVSRLGSSATRAPLLKVLPWRHSATLRSRARPRLVTAWAASAPEPPQTKSQRTASTRSTGVSTLALRFKTRLSLRTLLVTKVVTRSIFARARLTRRACLCASKRTLSGTSR